MRCGVDVRNFLTLDDNDDGFKFYQGSTHTDQMNFSLRGSSVQ